MQFYLDSICIIKYVGGWCVFWHMVHILVV